MSASKLILVALAIGVFWLPMGSFAADADESSTQLQEIVVTAEKRAEDIQRVPISISVIDNAAFDRLSIQDLSDVANMTPGVDYQVTGPKNLLSIRGIYS